MSKTRSAFIIGALMIAVGVGLVAAALIAFTVKTLARWLREGRERRRIREEQSEAGQRRWVEENL